MQKMQDKMLEMQVKAKLSLERLWKDERGNEFNDGGSTNWGRNVAIGFAIAAILFLAVKAFMPEILDKWKAKVLEFFN